MAVLYYIVRFGGVPKRLKGVVLKTTRRVMPVRGFKSHPLRQNKKFLLPIYEASVIHGRSLFRLLLDCLSYRTLLVNATGSFL